MLKSILQKSASRVFTQLGSSHSEKIYHKALHSELICQGFNITSEYHVPTIYTDSSNKKHILESERIDILIHNHNSIQYEEFNNNKNIILELKSITKSLQEPEINQIKKYIKQLSNLDIQISNAFLINFPQPSSKDIKNEIEFLEINNTIT